MFFNLTVVHATIKSKYMCTEIERLMLGEKQPIISPQKVQIKLLEKIYTLEMFELHIIEIKESPWWDTSSTKVPDDDEYPLITVGLLQTQIKRLGVYDVDNTDTDPDPLFQYYQLDFNSKPAKLANTIFDITVEENKTISQLKENARKKMESEKGSKEHIKLENAFLKAADRIRVKHFEKLDTNTLLETSASKYVCK